MMNEELLVSNPDASIWAEHFIEAVENNPDILLDKKVITGWFANSIMAGYDFAKKEIRQEAEIAQENTQDELAKRYLNPKYS